MAHANIIERQAAVRAAMCEGLTGEAVKRLARQFGTTPSTIRADEHSILGDGWGAKYRDTHLVGEQNARARALGIGGHVDQDEWRAVCARHGNTCAACGAAGPLTMDHIRPLSKGGTHSVDNIQPLCKTCNCRKGATWEDQSNEN